MIAGYFNNLKLRRCGVCDNCLREKPVAISVAEFENIRQVIQNALKENSLNLRQLLNKLHYHDEKKIRKILQFLQEESRVSITDEGFIKLKTDVF